MNFFLHLLSAIPIFTLGMGIAASSIIATELTRDFWHLASHEKSFKPLLKAHYSHHRITKSNAVDFSQLDEEIYVKSHWYWDIPEAIVMLLVCLLYSTFVFVLFS